MGIVNMLVHALLSFVAANSLQELCSLPAQEALQKIRQKNTMRREVTVELSSQGFWKTGIRSDVCQVTEWKDVFS